MEMPGQAAAAAAAPRDSHSAGHKKRKRSAEASRSSSESSSESSSSDERGQEKRRKEKRKKEKRKKEKRKKEKRKKEKRKKEKRKKEPRKSSPVQLSKASCVAFSRAPRQCGLWNEYRVLACSGTESHSDRCVASRGQSVRRNAIVHAAKAGRVVIETQPVTKPKLDVALSCGRIHIPAPHHINV